MFRLDENHPFINQGKTIYGRTAKYENKNGEAPCKQESGTAENNVCAGHAQADMVTEVMDTYYL